ncbi:hypothetical protein QQP08_002061 [Theobroma cacao]|nr:hypothetical protein QQP08_002061 [Theobroma cacao]
MHSDLTFSGLVQDVADILPGGFLWFMIQCSSLKFGVFLLLQSNQRINSSGITCYLYTCYLYDEYSLYWGREASLTAKRNQTRERKKHGGRHKTREEGKTNDVGVRSMGNPKTQMVTV